MARALALFVCLMFSAALTACDSPEETEAPQASDAATSAPAAGAAGEQANGAPGDAAPAQAPANAAEGAPQAVPAPSPAARAEETCPVQVPATSVTVVNTKGGVALYFTTTGTNVDEVRRRVGALASASTTAPGTPIPEREVRRGSDVPYWDNAVRPELVPLQATAEEIAEGARLVLTPLDPIDLEPLRAYAHNHGDRMRLGSCAPDFLKQRINAAAAGTSDSRYDGI